MPARSWLTLFTVAFALVPVWMPPFLPPPLLIRISATTNTTAHHHNAADHADALLAACALGSRLFLGEAAGARLFLLLGA